MQISILHFNENSDREHAKLQDGTERVNIAFPKYKKGEHTVKKILVACTYSKSANEYYIYRDTIKIIVINHGQSYRNFNC